MRARLLLCLPIAAMLTLVILGLGASFGSAVATRLTVAPPTPTIQLAGYDPSSALRADRAGPTPERLECSGVRERLEALMRSAMRCDDDPRCLASPLFCPIELDGREAREAERLRRVLAERCATVLVWPESGSDPWPAARALPGDAAGGALPGTSVLLELDGCGYGAQPQGASTLAPSPRTFQF